MPNRIAVTTLNASTIDILNTIRANGSREYQELVPEVQTANDIPRVGEALRGYPAMANQFLSALINRIAMVRVRSATFNNAYAMFKKGYLEFGETVEEVFVNIAKALEYNPEKAEKREFKRTIPDVRSVFHVMNYRVMYPITIQDMDLQRAFLSMDGVQDLIARIVDSIYTAAEYDEFLLFKYLLIKAISRGKMYPVAISDADMSNAAVQFRALSNVLPFMSGKYNESGVKNTTPKSRQYIFMDAEYNARYDVNVLAGAFNMDKADFMGRLTLIDSFSTFDNERFDIIRENSDMLEEVTEDELALMKDVKAVLIDSDWFQVYDNANKFTEKYVSSGLYWNYFYHVWKTVSHSPFANAVVFVSDSASITAPETLTYKIASIDKSDAATVLTFEEVVKAGLAHTAAQFVQTEQTMIDGIAVHRYGAIILPKGKDTVTPVMELDGVTYTGTLVTASTATVGTEITFTKAG